MDIQKIELCLLGKSLTDGTLVDHLGHRCAVGEILHCVGVKNEKLRKFDDNPLNKEEGWRKLLREFKDELKFYGISKTEEVKTIIEANDDEYNSWYQNQEYAFYEDDGYIGEFKPSKTRAEFVIERIKGMESAN